MFLVKGGEVGGLNVFPPGRNGCACDLCGVEGIVFYGRYDPGELGDVVREVLSQKFRSKIMCYS